MKKIYLLIVLFLITGVDISHAQLAKDSWSFGFGFSYPRYQSANISALNSNYGGYLSLQRNFSEHFGLRLKTGLSHIEGEWVDQAALSVTQSTNVISTDLDFVYYLIPCEAVSPYLFAGAGGIYRMLDNNAIATLEENALGMQYNLGAGVEWNLNNDWKIATEYGYHSTGNSELDGAVVNAELNPRDAYWTASVGLVYFFDKGEPSTECTIYQGVIASDMTDYNKIEDMIKKHIPKEVIKEVVVDKYIMTVSEDKLVLVGVNFAFDKSSLLPESYSVLDKAVILLNDKPTVNVEIDGYTDYIGTDEYNQKLSLERAQVVKDYLVSKGINQNRLTPVGYGKGNPVADNETEEGRAMNRRIVFRIVK